MIVINITLIVFSAIASLWVFHTFIYQTWIAKQKFKIYCIRDRLSSMILSKELDENDVRYIFLRDSIRNSLLFYSQDFEVVRFLKAIVDSEKNEPEKQKFLEMVSSIKVDDKLAPIMRDIFEETMKAFRREILPLYIVVPFAYVVSLIVQKILHFFEAPNGSLSKKLKDNSVDVFELKGYEDNFIRPALV